ncbi:quinone-dependent dihydroorotate dehydrogenase [Flexithrix dorotheae]|uniref:quinone-dependent dihydroorotate dehydrogenase n=1 Tax=Flexithrix dorotheae TaxID=70993 RepID=UPI00039DCF96|nr:quinone-dependent dihydroorotate dehydrogenase [Flexithrix dorotheae]
MYKVIRPFLFLFDPEFIHHLMFKLIKIGVNFPFVKGILKKVYVPESKQLEREVFGLKFPGPVGLAAGFDKNALLIDELSVFGFGFIEIGTVTPKPQDGNPRPRLFRVKADKGIINRMGFNNDGLDSVVERLKNKKSNVIVGGNIGKNKVTPNEEAINDYLIAFEKLFEYVDYFTVNVSSPNTPGLRDLQEKEPLKKLLFALKSENLKKTNPKPILLKIAPDLTNSQLDDIIEIVTETKIDGIIATNTTISREGLKTSEKEIEKIGNGGLSGKPVTSRSTEVIKYLYDKSGKQLKIIGVGGIHSVEDAVEKIKAGACLVQVYTGFIYEGPDLIKKINSKIGNFLK